MDRREFLRLTGGAAIVGVGFTAMGRRPAWAQEAASLADLGLPDVTVTMTEAGFEVSPAEVTAGWTLVTFTNQMPEGNFNSSDFTLVPADMTPESAMNLFATPEAETVPAWIYETLWAGGPFGVGGTSNRAVVLLSEGAWLVWSAGEAYPAATLTVTAASAAPVAPTITADVQVAMQEFAFVGLEDSVPAGPHVWEVTTTGDQPHVLVLFGVPDGTTAEQLLGVFMGPPDGSPAADGFDPSTIEPAGGCATLSTGQTAWVALDLAAGTYGAVCFVPDIQTGTPHAMLGMVSIFTVG